MVKAKTLQIVWHSKEPVFCCDFSPTTPNLLATGGADKDIRFWEVTADTDGSPSVNYVGSTGGVSSTINAVRFSPLGDVIASGGDGGEVLLWRPADQNAPRALGAGDGPGPLWKVSNALRGHAGDVLDLSWSPDGSALVTGSVENWATLWDVDNRRGVGRLDKHQHYVQGVAWDPLGYNVLTVSNDRTVNVYGPRPPPLSRKTLPPPPVSSAAMLKEFCVLSTLTRRVMADNNDAGTAPNAQAAANGEPAAPPPPPPVMPAPPARHPLFQDEDLSSFFRRPDWSPDGSVVVLPAGLYKTDPSCPPTPCSYIFARGDWTAPLGYRPSLGRPPVVVRFSPVLYRLREGEGGGSSGSEGGTSCPLESLPYRMVWAVGTLDSVLVYDTQCLEPLLLLGGLHMASITDLAWSSDGLTLAVSSSDGYCSLAVFQPGELGEPLSAEELPPAVAARVARTAAKRHAERLAKQQQKVSGKTAPAAAPSTTAEPAANQAVPGPQAAPAVAAAVPAAPAAAAPAVVATVAPAAPAAANAAAAAVLVTQAAATAALPAAPPAVTADATTAAAPPSASKAKRPAEAPLPPGRTPKRPSGGAAAARMPTSAAKPTSLFAKTPGAKAAPMVIALDGCEIEETDKDTNKAAMDTDAAVAAVVEGEGAAMTAAAAGVQSTPQVAPRPATVAPAASPAPATPATEAAAGTPQPAAGAGSVPKRRIVPVAVQPAAVAAVGSPAAPVLDRTASATSETVPAAQPQPAAVPAAARAAPAAPALPAAVQPDADNKPQQQQVRPAAGPERPSKRIAPTPVGPPPSAPAAAGLTSPPPAKPPPTLAAWAADPAPAATAAAAGAVAAAGTGAEDAPAPAPVPAPKRIGGMSIAALAAMAGRKAASQAANKQQ